MKAIVTVFCAVVGVGMLIAATSDRGWVRLIYNASDSAPRGFYSVSHPTKLRLGDYVVARLPEASSQLAAERGYLPRSVPVLKQIAAMGGQRVCIRDGWVYIDGTAVASTLRKDGQSRPLLAWHGCRQLVDRELFLLNPSHRASFDSRYVGPLDASFVLGVATKW
jgi:conjugative transfer signal peptidase TraF